MGVLMIGGRTNVEVADRVKEFLANEGWSDVVSGNGYVTVPSFPGSYKSRLCIQFYGVDSGKINARVGFADSHTDGNTPSGIYWPNNGFIQTDKMGLVMVSYPNEHISLFGLEVSSSIKNGGLYHVVDQDGNDYGTLCWWYYLNHCTTDGCVKVGLDNTGYFTGADNKVRVGRYYMYSGSSFIGWVLGIRPSRSSTNHSIGIAHKIGSEYYLNNRYYLYRVG